jgi:hypothetical protein
MQFEPEQKVRITDFEAYLHYLKLMYKMQRTDAYADTVALDNLMRYVYSIYMRKEVHAPPVNVWPAEFGHNAAFLHKYWNTFNETAPGNRYSTIVPLTDEQINQLFDEDCKEIR